MDATLILDEDLCVGYGACVDEDPDAIELEADGCARLRLAVLPAERARALCDACPAGALAVA